MLMPWNAARAASKRPLPKPRKVHAPVGTAIADLVLDGRQASYMGLARAHRERTCAGCHYFECCCGLLAQRADEEADRAHEMQQEAQRAQLARDVGARHSMRPGVQQHLRHGDPRRMSLGYNERDYDRARVQMVETMRAEVDSILAHEDLTAGEDKGRLATLLNAIDENERKLPQQLRKSGFARAIQAIYENNETLFGIPALQKIGSTDVTTDPDSFFAELEAKAGKEIRASSALQQYFEDQAKLLARDRPELAVQLQNYGYLK